MVVVVVVVVEVEREIRLSRTQSGGLVSRRREGSTKGGGGVKNPTISRGRRLASADEGVEVAGVF